MALHDLINNFTGGEVTPEIDARLDLQKYKTSCRVMENYRPKVHGGATFRASTLFLAQAKYGTRKCRVLPFNYSTSTSYVIELGHQYMRFFLGTGVRVTVSTASAVFWDYVSGYTAGDYAQWHGVVYKCTVDVPASVPPAFNTPPNLDPGHWTTEVPYELASPYTEDQLPLVRVREINDVLYLTHPDWPPYKLTRTSAVTFTLSAVTFRYPPLTDENADGTITMALGATSGNTTLTCSTSMFTASHVGAYFEVRHLKDATSVKLDLSGSGGGPVDSSAIEVVGDWTVVTAERWYGTLQVLRSIDGGTTWQVARQSQSDANSNRELSGSENTPTPGRPRVQLKLRYTPTGDPYGTPPWVGTVPTSYVKATATLEVANAYVAGLVKVTGYVSGTVVNVTVVQTAASTAATTLWSQSEFDATRGYPRAIALYEQRLLFGGTTAKPNTVWGSTAADFENFLYSDLDDAAIKYQPAATQQNPIQWLESLTQVAMGTSGEEMRMGSGNQDEPMTPANVVIRSASNTGSDPVAPIIIDRSLLFVQRQGKRIREYVEANPYNQNQTPPPVDVTLLAEHIFQSGITEMTFCRLPDAQVYATLQNGTLAVMAWNKEQNVNAWARWTTGGRRTDAFESVCCVYGSPNDVTFAVVQRTIGGNPVRYIEAFTAEGTDKQDSIYGMDSATVVSQAASTTVNVGSYLEGQAVAVVADGVAIGNSYTGEGLPVVTGGQITLPQAAAEIRVGIPYWGTLMPQKLDSMLGNGTSQGRRKKITEVCVRMKDTLGLQYGNSKTPLSSVTPLNFSDEAVFRASDDPMDAAPPLYTGDMILAWAGGNELNGDLMLAQVQPFPQTILGIFAKLETHGE